MASSRRGKKPLDPALWSKDEIEEIVDDWYDNELPSPTLSLSGGGAGVQQLRAALVWAAVLPEDEELLDLDLVIDREEEGLCKQTVLDTLRDYLDQWLLSHDDAQRPKRQPLLLNCKLKTSPLINLADDCPLDLLCAFHFHVVLAAQTPGKKMARCTPASRAGCATSRRTFADDEPVDTATKIEKMMQNEYRFAFDNTSRENACAPPASRRPRPRRGPRSSGGQAAPPSRRCTTRSSGRSRRRSLGRRARSWR